MQYIVYVIYTCLWSIILPRFSTRAECIIKSKRYNLSSYSKIGICTRYNLEGNQCIFTRLGKKRIIVAALQPCITQAWVSVPQGSNIFWNALAMTLFCKTHNSSWLKWRKRHSKISLHWYSAFIISFPLCEEGVEGISTEVDSNSSYHTFETVLKVNSKRKKKKIFYCCSKSYVFFPFVGNLENKNDLASTNFPVGGKAWHLV